MVTNQVLHSDVAISPGEYLAEVMQELGMKQSELARRMGRPPQAVNEIIKGEKVITPDSALQLEKVVGVPAHIWTSLESEFQLVKAKKLEENQIEEEVRLLDSSLYLEMSKLTWVLTTKDKKVKVSELRRFFGVASLHNLTDVHAYSPAFRQAEKTNAEPLALAAWLRRGVLEASAINVEPFSKEKLKASLKEIRVLTTKNENIIIPQLTELLAKCGIAFVLMPHLPKTYINGATFWLNPTKAVLMLSNRGKWADMFWFNLFHEIGHILLHDKRHTFIDLDNGAEDPNWRAQENEANNFSRNTLIDQKLYKIFLDNKKISQQAIIAFAKNIGIASGIVIGRLQKDDELKPHEHIKLKEKYDF